MATIPDAFENDVSSLLDGTLAAHIPVRPGWLTEPPGSPAPWPRRRTLAAPVLETCALEVPVTAVHLAPLPVPQVSFVEFGARIVNVGLSS